MRTAAAGGPDQQLRAAILLAILWTAVLFGSGAMNLLQLRSDAVERAKIEARGAFNKDLVYRRWAAGHGGVYAPVTEKTPPNPHLSHVAERDIKTPSGRALTLVNPAYMTRQVHELGRQQYGYRGNITSLKPIRLENTPDPWERQTLEAFARGPREIISVEPLDGEDHLRLMRALVTEKRCLKCHGKDGYKEGDIRGGVSVSMPMEPYMAQAWRSAAMMVPAHGFIWLLGLMGLRLAHGRIRAREQALQEHRMNLEHTVQERTVQLTTANEHLARENRVRLQAEEQLRESLLELARSNQELQQFAYVASHDLQEPLRMVASYTELLARRYEGELDDKADMYMAYAVDGARRMQELINDLLEYSRVGTRGGDFETTDAAEVVTEVLRDLKVLLKDNQAKVVIGDLPTVRADRSQLAQVFQNLITNGLKFRGEEPPVVEVTAREEDDRWEFTVADNGIGIDPQHYDRIFIIFQRLHVRSEYAGSGIGLSIVKKIVERHGGTVLVESNEPTGTRFRFSIAKVLEPDDAQ